MPEQTPQPPALQAEPVLLVAEHDSTYQPVQMTAEPAQEPEPVEEEDENEKIEAALLEQGYQRALGYQITDTEKTIDMDKDGNPKPVRIKNTTKNIVPDTMAIMYWLNNRKRTQWAQRQEVALSAGDDSEDVLIYLPANGRDDGDQQES